MLEKWFRPIYQRRIVQPLAPLFSRLISPDQITITGGVLGVTAALLISLHHFWSASLILLLSGIFDTFDGSIARHMNQASDFGCVLDIFTDRIVECAVILGLFFIDTAHRAIPSLLMLISITLCITSFLAVGIFTPDTDTEKSFYYSIGLIERFEAFIFFFAMLWFPAFFSTIAYLFSSLVFITAFIRLYQFKAKGIKLSHVD